MLGGTIRHRGLPTAVAAVGNATATTISRLTTITQSRNTGCRIRTATSATTRAPSSSSRRYITSTLSSLSSSSSSSTSLLSSPIRDPASAVFSTNQQSPVVDKSSSVSRRSFTTINQNTPYNLCFLRHGQSTWNRDNRFIGWTDTPLTDDGVLEARLAGKMLANSGILFDEVHTSLLRRSIRTANLVLMELGQEYIPVHKHWRLNERNYGDLVGLDKKETVRIHGKDQVKRWRRSYDEPPPPMSPDHEYHPAKDPRYRHMLDQLPSSESLRCTKERSSVYWDEVIAPDLKKGKTLLIVGHENNLRSLIMLLEDISKDDIINLSLPRAVPLAYRLDENLKPLDRPDGKLDEATGFLRGEWLGGDEAVAEILERDSKQVYDTAVNKNLELCDSANNKKWNQWMDIVNGSATSPSDPSRRLEEAKAKAA